MQKTNNTTPEATHIGVDRRLVLSISRMTIHNGPGLRTVIYFKGCPLRCLWCSTPESQKSSPEIAVYPRKCIHCNLCIAACPIGAISVTGDSIVIDRSSCDRCGKCAEVCYSEAIMILGQLRTVEDLVAESKRDLAFYRRSGGGVVISGGEPLLNSEFALKLLQTMRREGISVGVDTCGYVPWASIEPILACVSFFLWDIKHMDPEKHQELTGVSNQLILSNTLSISQKNIPLYIRLPVIPGYNDSEENLRATCAFAQGLTSVVELDLIPLHHLGKARYDSLDRAYPIGNIRLIENSVLQDMKCLVESYGLRCTIQS